MSSWNLGAVVGRWDVMKILKGEQGLSVLIIEGVEGGGGKKFKCEIFKSRVKRSLGFQHTLQSFITK